jgi:hypothetical protein
LFKIITDEFIANNYRTSLENRALLQEETTKKPLEVIELLDAGKLRVAKGDMASKRMG